MNKRAKYPWDKMDHEPEEAHGRFLEYLHMERPRNAVHYARKAGVPVSVVRRYQGCYAWNIRLEAYDAWLLKEVTERIIEQRTAASLHHLEILSRARGICEAALTQLEEEIEEARDGNNGGRILHPRDLGSFIEKVINMERMIYGEPHAGVTRADLSSFDFSSLSDQEIELFSQLYARITGEHE